MSRAAPGWRLEAAGPARLRDAVRRVRTRETFWGEVFSGFGAVACGVLSWSLGAPLEEHPVLGPLARLLGGHIIKATWIAAGAGQIVALLTDRWPWRWLAALAMTAGWGVPALQALKSGADAPLLAGACLAWVAVNAAAAWCLVRHGCPRAR